MATQMLRDCKVWLGAYDLSGSLSRLGLQYGAELVDDTVFGDQARSRAGGLKTVVAQHEGVWNNAVGGVDEVLFSNLGLPNMPMSIAPLTGAEGEVAYAFQSVLGQYTPGAEVGALLRFSVRGEACQSPLVRGLVCLNGAKSATGNGSVFQLGALTAGQKLYAALHVLSATGTSPSFTAKVQSAALVGFGSPTDRIAFSAATAIGAQWASPVSGPITDQFWRLTWTISGTTPVFGVVGVVGIL